MLPVLGQSGGNFTKLTKPFQFSLYCLIVLGGVCSVNTGTVALYCSGGRHSVGVLHADACTQMAKVLTVSCNAEFAFYPVMIILKSHERSVLKTCLHH